MLKSFFESLEETFINFNIRRLFFLVTIIAVLVLGFYLFNSYTNYGQFQNLEKKTELLNQLFELKIRGIESDPELESIYNEIVNDLNTVDTRHNFIYEPYTFLISDIGIKVLSSLAIPLLILIVGGLTIEKKESKSFMAGIIIYAIICVFVALLIPTLDNLWHNGIINFLFAGLLLALLMKLFSTK